MNLNLKNKLIDAFLKEQASFGVYYNKELPFVTNEEELKTMRKSKVSYFVDIRYKEVPASEVYTFEEYKNLHPNITKNIYYRSFVKKLRPGFTKNTYNGEKL